MSLALGRAIKLRTGLPVMLGGAGARGARDRARSTGVKGIDAITNAADPAGIRKVFAWLRETPRGRMEAPCDPEERGAPVAAIRRGPRLEDEAWPLPDFSIYDLDLYRRDPIVAEGAPVPAYDGSVGRVLVLPYAFTRDCQFNCAFCQTVSQQTHLPFDDVARQLDTLATRYNVEEFFLADTQINVVGADFARALLAARVKVRWTDSFRVRPATEELLDVMREAGCVGLTVGVESASDAVLKKMMKGHTGKHATQFVEWAEAREMMVRVNLLPCFPGETAEDFEITRAWVHDNARCIDDLSPSSFYLTNSSPVGSDPARFGLVVRADRTLRGEDRFRKQHDTLAYDEVDGMTWEEREPTLRAAEGILRKAWLDGAPERIRGGGVRPAMMLGLRRAFDTKNAIYEAIARWSDGAPAPRADAPAAVTSAAVTPRALVGFGPFAVGAALAGGWTLASLALVDDGVRLGLAGAQGAVTLGVSCTPPRDDKRSPFDSDRARVWYENTAAPFPSFRDAGLWVRDALARALAPDAAHTWSSWREGARWA